MRGPGGKGRVDFDLKRPVPDRDPRERKPSELGEDKEGSVPRILVVDDQSRFRKPVANALRSRGHEVAVAGTAEEGGLIAQEEDFDVVLTDVRLPGMDGIELLETLKRQSPDTEVIVMTGFGTIEDAVAAMQRGAHNYLSKPFDSQALQEAVDAALARRGLHGGRTEAEPEPTESAEPEEDSFGAIIGQSRPIRDALELVRKVAATDSTALITGETGTGKELIGRAIHQASRRRKRIFCAVNSATFPETLLESELFGHCRGAFTGASANKKGLFEHASGGTVFLDELAEMPLPMQAKLLRFLQTGEIRPVGSEHTRRVDVRLVTATNKDLEREVEEGRFREDLYYRLAVIPIHLPPLRERTEDIPLLADYFLKRQAACLGNPTAAIEPEAMDLLQSYGWPGNVRELEHSIECGAALGSDGRIGPQDLPARVRERGVKPQVADLESLEVVERVHILNTLEKVGWNRKKAARILKISTTTLWRRLKEFGIDGPVARRSADEGPAASTCEPG